MTTPLVVKEKVKKEFGPDEDVDVVSYIDVEAELTKKDDDDADSNKAVRSPGSVSLL